ncbi:hypothetical protein NLU13_1691 [Sarocladium strictum]|uniref:Protein BIG1 n=1 Tax=Sarocladium strictum TaxID=5046 RepID=A0AA39LCG5_SARSR|nr:hypothetical protein NLU13_1691 [Sarocladium strictum]
MRSSVLAGALAFAGFSAAFSDSSPWIVASTAPFKAASNNNKIQTSSAALKTTKDFLSTCPTDSYVIVVQPGLHYADLAVEGGSPMKSLIETVDRFDAKGKFIVPEVVGEAVDGTSIKDLIHEACGQERKEVQVHHIELRALVGSGDIRTRTLTSNDDEAASTVLSKLKDGSSTLIFFGTPANAAERTVYEPEFEEAVMMDLKRSVQAKPSRRADNGTDWNKLPLFEKYQFFTPGIFMGLLAVIFMGSILTVGIKALSSLQVSYGAFEKDMGPAAHKKQQ